MKILEIITPSRLGGAEKYVGWMSKRWSETGHEVLIGIRECKEVEAFYRTLDLPIKKLSISGKINPFAKSRITNLISQFKPDIVHTHLSTATHWGLKAARGMNIKGIAHMHSFNSVGPYKNAHKIIAVSHAVKTHLMSHGFPESKIAVVYPSSVISSTAPARDVQKLGDPIIACAARLREDKGIGVLVDAFIQLRRKHTTAALVLCGDGPMLTTLEARGRSERLPIHCLGYRSDIPSVFAAASVAVLPSIRPEGYGMVLYESQAVGTPVVTTTAGGAQEAMVANETGLLVPPSSPEALAAAIDNIISNPNLRTEMSTKAREFASTRNINASAKALLVELSR